MGFNDEYLALRKKRKKAEEETKKGDAVAPLFVNKTAALYKDDIAPVATTKKTVTTKDDDDRKWFQKGAFEDGYQFGDVTKTILGTVTDTVENLGTGIVGMGERVVDALAYVAPYAAKGQFYQNGGAYQSLETQKMFDKSIEESKKGMESFIKKDLYDEQKVTRKIIESTTGVDASTYNAYSVLGDKSDALVQSAGQLGATIGLQAVGVPWFVTTGVTSFGGEAENAFNEGASYEEAGMSAAIAAGAEILTEKISGGIKFGGKALDDVLVKQIARGVSNKTIRTLSKLGLDMAGEGFEEVLSGVMGAVGQKITYADDKELKELFSSEEALESFIGGAVLGGGMGSINAVKSHMGGVDYASGLTANEQKVIDKVYADRIAEEEKSGKVSQKKKSEIYDAVLEEMEKGYISTDTIEEVLGGETYKSYQSAIEEEDSIRKVFDSLNQMKQGEMTGEQLDMRNEMKRQLEEIKSKDQRNLLKTQLGEEVFGMVKGDRLAESYNERSRRGQAFEADLTQYDKKQQAVIQKAVDSGILNNTRRTHEFVDMIAKISADKGVPFDFTNNEKLKESGFAVDGKTVNGYVTKDGITLNIHSSKALNSVVGHEITHVLEGTELYDVLQQTVIEYAKSKGDYQGRYDSLTKLYDGVKDANVDAELTADLVGDYLFTDSDFINNLSANNRNVFQKIYDEIKYLCKVATAGSKEARELEKVKRAFEKAYQESGKAQSDTKYSISDKNIKDETTGYASGETYFTMSYTQDGKVVGTLEYGEYNGEANVKMIEVNPEYRRRGIGKKLLQELQKKYPDSEIDFGMSTPDGTKLIDAVTYTQTDERVAEGKRKLMALQTELVDVERRLNELYDLDELTAEQEQEMQRLGERWDELYYNEIRNAQEEYGDKPESRRFVKYSISDSDGKPIDSTRVSENELDTKYSLSHSEEIAHGQSDYMVNHRVHISDDELAEAQKVTAAMVDVMMKYSSILPEDKIGKVLTKNGSYDRSVENTTICVRTLAYNEFVDKVQEEIGRPLTQMESFLVSQKLYDIAVEPQCLYCYVSLDRKAFNDMLLRYMTDRDTVLAKYNHSDKSPEAISKLYEEFLNGRKDTKPMKDRFNKWLSYVDNGTQLLSLADIATEDRQSVIKANGGILAAQLADARAYAQSASWSKIQKNYVAYRDEILKLNDRVVKNLNEHYGLRWYSFSDYSAAFIVENMQQITDASIRGLKGLAYTKDTDFAEIFAQSGMNINVSVFVNQDADGNFFIDEKQSADFEKAKALRERYPNVGIVATVTNDDALRWVGSQEWSDVIIPFHIVRTGTDVAEYYKWLNYTAESADTISNKDMWEAYLDSLNLKSEGARKKVSKNIYPSEHKNDKSTYLNLCESRGLSPRFARFAGEDWYMKLVNETRLSADASPALKPSYNLEAAQASFQKFVEKGGYEGGWYKDAINIDAEAKAVAADVLAGKKANEVSYGRQDGFSPEALLAGRKVNRKHGQLSLSADGEQPLFKGGNFRVYGKDIALETAPVQETAPVETAAEDAMFPDNLAPIDEEAYQDERLASLTDEDAPPEREEQYKPIRTAQDLRNAKLSAIQTELDNDRMLREESFADYNQEVDRLQAEYDSKKKKDTKAAQSLLRRIERVKRLRDSTDAEYEKRINSLETREKLTREGKPTTRQELHGGLVEDIKARFTNEGYDFDEVLKNAKNLSTFATVDNTPQRVMEKALGYKEGQLLSDITVNQVAQNETEGIKWLNSYTDRKNGVLAQLSKKYGIKAGSKESAAAQMYAEGFYVGENNDIIEYGDAELAKDFPDSNVQANIKGLANDPVIRAIYDETLSMINESRTRNAYPEIQRLDNYFLHFRAMDDTFSRLGLPFNPNDIRAKDLPTDLNGVTADLKPGQPYFASAMHRTGKRTSFDLLGGLERYLSSAKNQIYHIDDIQTLRALRNYIADTYGQASGLEHLDTLSEEEQQERINQVYGSHLSTFAKFLNEEANILAGKTALIDRGLEGIIGRRGITFLDTINKQVGSNMVGFNVSSSLTNFLPVAQTFAKTNKFAFTKAFAQTVAHKVSRRSDGFAENSPVMIRRKGADRFYRTPWQKMSDPAYVLMSAVDDISTELIARTKYNELVKNGMDSQTAHYETDKWVSRLMGDRSLGQQPQIYNSKMLGLVTKFQLEVRNQLDSQFYDTIQETKVSNEHIESELARNAKTAAKVASTFVQLAAVQHLFGKAFESVAGYNPAFDIIEVLMTAFGFDDDEESEDTALDNIEQGFLALLEDLPYASTFLDGGRIPISAALPVEELVKGVDEWGNEKSRWETLGEIAPYYALPAGYGQIKKTAQGLSMFSEDHPIAGSYTDSGNLRFPVEDTLGNRVQAGIFGQWANDNARDYFDNERQPLKKKQIEEFIDLDMPIREYWDYREGLKEQETLEDKFDYIAGLDLSVEQKNIMINNVVDRKEDVDMANYDDFDSYEEFDFYTKNREKYEFLEANGVSYAEYKSSDDAKKKYNEVYSWYKDNPEKVTVAKAITDNMVEYREYTSALNDIRGDDNDGDGRSDSGTAKKKKTDYIFGLNLDYGQKVILYRSLFYSKKDRAAYDDYIFEYVNSRDDLTFDDRVTILRELGFTVTDDGDASW